MSQGDSIDLRALGLALCLAGWVGYLLWKEFKAALEKQAQALAEEQKKKEIERLIQKNQSECHQLVASFQAGLVQYKTFDKTPLAVSDMGIRNGLFTWYRHADATKYEQFCEIITKINDAAAMKKQIISFVVDEGSVWSQSRGSNHHMTNFFLQNLKKENFILYVEMIEACYSVKILVGKQKLYRRDTRTMEQIFDEGFQPKQNRHNAPETRRAYFAQERTEDYGVSLSKTIPPLEFGANGVYVINIPEHHQLHLIDIVESPRNKKNLSTYRLQLQEVNSVDAIPREYIVGFSTSTGKFILNKHYGRPAVVKAKNEPIHTQPRTLLFG